MQDQTYDTIENPYNELLSRNASSGIEVSSDTTNDDINEVSSGREVQTGQSLNDSWLDTWIKSRNYQPRKQGFYIDARRGYIEAMQMFIGSGGIVVGGSVSYGKSSFTDSANAGYWISPEGIYFGSVSDTSKLKYDIGTGTFDFIGTISGRSTLTIANAINITGQLVTDLVNARLDTSSKTILDAFTFGVSGALQIGTYSAGVSGDIRISPNGIVGRNKSNVTTFAIDGTTGDATFGGNLTAPSGTLGTITAATITGGSIDGVTITGGTVQTGTTGKRVVMSSNVIEFYNATTNVASLNAGSLSATAFLRIDSPDSASAFVPIEIYQKGDADSLWIKHDSTSTGMAIDLDYSGTATQMIYGLNNSASSIGMYLTNNNTSNTADVLVLNNPALGRGLFINNTNTTGSYGLEVNNDGSNYAVYIHHDKSTATTAALNATNSGTGTTANFRRLLTGNNTSGNATVVIEQGQTTSTNFRKMISFDFQTIWTSDGTDPNNSLSGSQGDICLNCDATGKIKYCDTGTTWI